MARSRTRISETVYLGRVKIGGSVGKTGVRGWTGIRIGRTWIDLSRWFGSGQQQRRNSR